MIVYLILIIIILTYYQSDKPRTALLAQYLASDVKRMRAYLDHMDKTPSVWDNASQPLKSMLAPRDAS